MKYFSTLSVLLLLTYTLVQAQVIWSDPITGNNIGSSPFNSTSGVTIAPGVTVSGISKGSGISLNNADNVYRARGWASSSTLITSNNDYFEFTITPPSGGYVSFTNFIFTDKVTSSEDDGAGPEDASLRSSLDSYGSTIDSWEPSSTSTSRTVNLTSGHYSLITAPVTFRIYGWNGGSNGTGYYQIEQFSFNGTAGLNAKIWQDPITSSSTITANPYNGGTGAVNSAGRVIANGITVSGISRGSGGAISGTNYAYMATSFNAGGLSPNTDDYFEFTLTPSPGKKMNFSNFSFQDERGTNGPAYAVLRSSVDNYTNNIGFSWTPGVYTPANRSFSLSGAQFQGLTTAVTFRIYAWAGYANSTYQINSFGFDGNITLPVSFGHLDVQNLNGNSLNVKWSTLDETNNDYFEIQGSKNGKDFTTLQTIRSKNGVLPGSALDYEVTINLSDMGAMLAIPAILALLSFGLKGRKRVFLLAVAVVAFTFQFVACRKSDSDAGVKTHSNLFVRIKQVDKNGNYSYSKVVNAGKINL